MTPSLYTCLKPESGQIKSLESELKNHIRENISILHEQSGGGSEDLPNMMSMQLAAKSQIYNGYSQNNVFNKEGTNVFMLVSGIQKKTEKNKSEVQRSKFYKQFNKNKREVQQPIL